LVINIGKIIMKRILLLVIGLSLLAAACDKAQVTSQLIQSPTPPVQNQVYDNAYMKLAVPSGWTATQVPANPAAVNITKDKYILYINTQATQASGVLGGRFVEIAAGSPSADAVVTEQPSPPCGNSETVPSSSNLNRINLYINNQTKEPYCKAPSNGKTVWYFSYIIEKQMTGYFNYYDPGLGKGYVITMSYNSGDVNNFPEKDSKGLNSALDEMASIAGSLEIKQR
jgi:hypothetical protein